MKISNQKKNKIARDAAFELTKCNPDILATACPLCKKTFSAATNTKVADIAELVAEALVIPQSEKNRSDIHLKITEPVII
jgi:Fe-S oxidoreductase